MLISFLRRLGAIILIAGSASHAASTPRAIVVFGPKAGTFGGLEHEGSIAALLWGRVEPVGSASRSIALAIGRRIRNAPPRVEIIPEWQPYEADTAGRAFARRAGVEPAKESLVALNAADPTLARIWPSTVASHLASRGMSASAIYPPVSAALLMGATERGQIRAVYATAGSVVTAIMNSRAALVVVAAKNLEQWMRDVAPIFRLDCDIYAIETPASANDSFSRCLFVGPSWAAGTLSSVTTRMDGVIAETDVSNTIVAKLTGNRAPGIAVHKPGGGAAALNAFEARHRFQRGIGLWTLVLAGVIPGVWLALRMLRLPSRRFRWPTASAEIAFTLAIPAGLTVAGHLAYPTIVATVGIGAAACLAVTAFAHATARGTGGSAVGWAALLCWAYVGLVEPLTLRMDGVENSLFGLYLYSGSRLYGYDNNYMGYLLAMAIWGGFALWSSDRTARFAPVVTGGVFALTALVLGLPSVGADAGGIATAVGAFPIVIALLYGAAPRWPYYALSFLCGIAAAATVGYVDFHMNVAAPTHLGSAISAISTGGWPGLFEILTTKLMVYARVVASPFAPLGIGAGVLFALWVRRLSHLSRAMDIEGHPRAGSRPLAAATLGSAWAAFCAIMFNDSGVISAALLMGATALFHLNFVTFDGGNLGSQNNVH